MSKATVSRGISTTQLRSGDKEGGKRAQATPKSGAGALHSPSGKERKSSKDFSSALDRRRSEKSRIGETIDILGSQGGIAGPKDVESGYLACTLLSLEQICELELLDTAATLSKLAVFLDMPTWKEDLQINIILTYHFNNYLYAQENKFSANQTSTFLGMMKCTLDKITEEALPMEKCLIYFKRLLLHHSAGKSPDGNPTNAWEIFGPTDVQLITDYAVHTIFQHYRLYQRVFTAEQEMSRMELTLNLEVPNISEPLSEAMKLEDYEFDQKRLQHEAEFLKIASLPSSNLLEHPEAIIEQTVYHPLDVLPPEVVTEVVTSVIQEAINKLTNEFEGTIEEHRSRILSKISSVEHTMLSKFGSKMSLASRINLTESQSSPNRFGSKGGLAPS